MNTRNLVPYIVGFVVTGFIVFLAYLIFFVPRIAEAQAIQTETTAQRVLNADLETKVSAVLAKAGNLPDLLAEGTEFHSAFPESPAQKDLFNIVMAAGAEAGVSVTGVITSSPAPVAEPVAAPGPVAGATAEPSKPAVAAAPAAPGESDSPLASVALTINATGGIEELKSFVGKLEALKRPIQIKSFSLSDAGGERTLNVTADSYFTKPLPAPAS